MKSSSSSFGNLSIISYNSLTGNVSPNIPLIPHDPVNDSFYLSFCQSLPFHSSVLSSLSTGTRACLVPSRLVWLLRGEHLIPEGPQNTGLLLCQKNPAFSTARNLLHWETPHTQIMRFSSKANTYCLLVFHLVCLSLELFSVFCPFSKIQTLHAATCIGSSVLLFFFTSLFTVCLMPTRSKLVCVTLLILLFTLISLQKMGFLSTSALLAPPYITNG